jgi:hypothetical protein
MRHLIFSILAGMIMLPNAYASDSNVDISKIQNDQSLFSDLIEDLGAALSYKAITPAEPMGTFGFDIGFEVSGTTVEGKGISSATDNSAPSTLYIPKLHLHKGLPFGFDVGAFYTIVPDSNIEAIGGELRYEILEGGTISPSVAVRGTYSILSGVDDLDLTTTGVEFSISKGFAMFTPYAGVGRIKMDGETTYDSLSDESITKSKYFVGLNFNLGLVNFTAETEQTGENSTTSAKFGFRF